MAELLLLIGHHCSLSDLLNLSLVNKHWYWVFMWLLWYSLPDVWYLLQIMGPLSLKNGVLVCLMLLFAKFTLRLEAGFGFEQNKA
jgi:hypothetical protein